jgi:transposase
MLAHPRQGHRCNDHRAVVDGIMFRTRSGCPWRDLPESYGNWQTVYNRHRRWSGDGPWEKVLDRLRAGCDEAQGDAWTVAAEATVIRAHQHEAGARRGRAELPGPHGGPRRMTRIRGPARRTRASRLTGRRWGTLAAADHQGPLAG